MATSRIPISETHPAIAAEAHGWDPTCISQGSSQIRNWKCSLGHIYDASVSKRTQRGHGCPYCSGHRVLTGFNDLLTTHPALAAEADGWDPTTISAGSNRKLQWKCPSGHQYFSLVADRALSNAKCPICLGRQVLAGFNDLATTHPALAAEADGWDPTTISAGSNRKLQWKCPSGHQFISVVASRSNGATCHFCSGHRVLAGFNDLATTHPQLAAQAYGWNPQTVSAGSNRKLQWKCKVGHTYGAIVSSRIRNPDGCPICYGRTALAGFNDLQTTHLEIAKTAHEWDPTTVTFGSGKKLKWKCNLGHIYESTVASRSNGNGCPFCSGHQVLVGFNDLATTHPEIASEAHNWDPTSLNAGSNKRRSWRCSLGHEWISMVAQRVSALGCPTCGGHRVLAGFNDLATTHPDISSEAHNWDPTTKTRGSDSKVSWLCTKGHHYRSTISSRVSGTGCPTCANFGFSPGRDGWIYLVANDHLQLLQIGITNTLKQRLKQHEKSGFDSLLDVRGPMDGELARRTELSIIQSLKKRNVIFAKDATDIRFSGYTESWAKHSLQISTIRELLDFVDEDEEPV